MLRLLSDSMSECESVFVCVCEFGFAQFACILKSTITITTKRIDHLLLAEMMEAIFFYQFYFEKSRFYSFIFHACIKLTVCEYVDVDGVFFLLFYHI